MSDTPASDQPTAAAGEACFHCGLPVPAGSHYDVEFDGEPRPMCCPGCQAVAQAIVKGGMGDFYRYRTEASRKATELVPDALKEMDLYDRPELQKSFVKQQAGELREASLVMEGIVCAACVWLSERHVSALPGVLAFTVNYSTHRAQVKWDNAQIHLSDILKAISAIGYIAHPFDPGRQEAVQKKERRQALRRIAVAGLGAMQVMMLAVALYAGESQGMDTGMRDFLRWASLVIATPVLLYSARGFFVSAWRDLRRRVLGMDVPVSLAMGGAFLASVYSTASGAADVYYDSVVMFTFFLLSGRYLEMMVRHRAGQAAEALVRLLPAVATRLAANGEESLVSVMELTPGDRVLIRPGDTVPADGRVSEGLSSVDESLLTGESLAVSKQTGETLVGGTVNVESPLVMTVEKVGTDTVLSSIVRLLDRAQSEKPRLATLANRVAAWFVGGLLVLAVGVAWWWWLHDPTQAFAITLSVLVVTCPCALSLATPAAMTTATGALTRLGVLTTRGHALETLAQATHMVFDKTGTLTLGRLHLEQVVAADDFDPEQALALAAALERHSEHPVARVLVAAANPLPPLSASEVRATPGQGIEGVINGQAYRIGNRRFVSGITPPGRQAGEDEVPPGSSEVVLADAHGVRARFQLRDSLRPDARAALQALQHLGLKCELLSGDAAPVVARVATELGIHEAHGGLMPADKLAHIRKLQQAGAVVAMVGDGVNDAPVLAGAQVSLAMGSGTQLAHASADMILLSEHLPHLPQAVQAARRTLSIIRQNLAWAVLYNLVAIPLAASGHVAPWMAALGMSLSSLLVVLNALRLGRLGSPSAEAVSPR